MSGLSPTNFGYERLIEEKAYRKELEGGEKKAESPVEVLKATRVLVHKYGRIRVQFGEAMSVRQLLAEQGALAPAETRDPEAFERALKVCGYAILGRINEAAVVTPTALTAAVLLTKIQKGIARGGLVAADRLPARSGHPARRGVV
jgi:glycerol-3-phosphate O-acyltransferase